MERALRKKRVGKVVSDKMDKTIVVAIADNVKHPLYKKVMKTTLNISKKTVKPITSTKYSLHLMLSSQTVKTISKRSLILIQRHPL